MYEAVFRIDDDSAYAHATVEDDATVELWCNEHCDLLHIDGPAEAVIDHVQAKFGIAELIREGEECLLITSDCLKEHEEGYIETYLSRHDCMLLPPLRYARGEKFCRVLSLDGNQLTDFYRDLVGDFAVDVESKREVVVPSRQAPMVSVGQLLPTLSDRQASVLHAAHRMGYYEIPRRITTAEIADEFDIDRRTAEEHLRRAENKLVNALVQHI